MYFVIDNSVWKIEFCRAFSDGLRRSDGSYTVGCADITNRIIYIQDDLQGFFLQKVICHEITHAYCLEKGIKVDIDTEELICDFVASFARDIIKTTDMIINNLRMVA